MFSHSEYKNVAIFIVYCVIILFTFFYSYGLLIFFNFIPLYLFSNYRGISEKLFLESVHMMAQTSGLQVEIYPLINNLNYLFGVVFFSVLDI